MQALCPRTHSHAESGNKLMQTTQQENLTSHENNTFSPPGASERREWREQQKKNTLEGIPVGISSTSKGTL